MTLVMVTSGLVTLTMTLALGLKMITEYGDSETLPITLTRGGTIEICPKTTSGFATVTTARARVGLIVIAPRTVFGLIALTIALALSGIIEIAPRTVFGLVARTATLARSGMITSSFGD